MQSVTPMEDNPWPHEMVLSIDADRIQLLDLLWVREAWGLHPAGDALPPPLADAPTPAGEPNDPRDRETWEKAWPTIWEAAVHHTAVRVEPSMFEERIRAAPGAQERAALLRDLDGPTWRDRFGDGAFNGRYREWMRAHRERQRAERPHSLADSPERRSLDELIPAWEAGLSSIVTIPCRGEYTRAVGGTVLLVTAAARRDPGRYAAALTAFADR